MTWFGAVLFALLAAGLVVWRAPIARWQALMAGGRILPGCVVAEAIGFLLLAVLVIVFRRLLE